MHTQSQTEQNSDHIKRLHSHLESGQAIVIIALVMVVLLGMLGLAIDGGGLYFLQRDAQNATDAAVLSATYAICTNGSPTAAALATMAQNGFNNNGITNKVTVNPPPLTGEGAGDSNYVEVILNAHKPAYFIQIVYRRPLEVTVRAVGHCNPPFDATKVGGLWAGSDYCNDGFTWAGARSTIVGGIFSNKTIKFAGDTTFPDVPGQGDISAAQDIQKAPGLDVTYAPGQVVKAPVPVARDPLDLDQRLYAPGGEIASMVPENEYWYIPTENPPIGDFKNGKWSANSGTIEGLFFVVGSVDLGVNVLAGPKGLTIVATGEILFSGEGSPSAPDGRVKYYDRVMQPTTTGTKYPGVVFVSYQNDSAQDKNACGQSGVKIQGKGAYEGILYAPLTGVNISQSHLDFHGAIIANTISYSGSTGDFTYDPSLLPGRPPAIQEVE